MKKQKRNYEIFNISFLDIISCGFGAIVLLLLISKTNVSDQGFSDLDKIISNFSLQRDNVQTLEKEIKKIENNLYLLKNEKKFLEDKIKLIVLGTIAPNHMLLSEMKFEFGFRLRFNSIMNNDIIYIYCELN